MSEQEAPVVGQDVESLARSLFSEDTPDSVVSEETTLSDPDNVNEEVVDEVVLQPVQLPAVVKPVQVQQQQQQVKPVVQATEADDEFKQFAAWKAQQQQQAQRPHVQQVQQQQAVSQPLAPEEADRLLNKFTLTQKEYDDIFKTESEEQSIKALNSVLQNTVKQAVTMAFHLVQDTEQRVVSNVRPYMQFADTQRELMLRETFYSEHPTLRGADPIINAVMTQMAQGGQKFESQKQLFDAVAKSTKAQLAQLGVTPGQGNTTQQKGSSVKRPMASLPTGGQGGSQQSAAQGHSGGSATARAIFG